MGVLKRYWLYQLYKAMKNPIQITPISPNYRAEFENRYYENHVVPNAWPNRPGADINPAGALLDYGRPSTVTRPSPAGYGKPSLESRPWYEGQQAGAAYGGPLTPENFRPTSNHDYSRPTTDYGRPNPDYGRPNPDYGRPNPDYGRPNPDYGRPNPEYGRPVQDYGSQRPDYGRPSVTKPSPEGYGRPSTDYNPPPPLPDYGRPTTVLKPSPGDYGRPAPDYNQLQPVGPDYGRPQPDYGHQPSYGRPSPDYGRPPTDYRPQPDYGRPVVDYGRPQPDYSRPPVDYGRPSPDYSRPPIDYGRPGCSTCRPDPDRPQPGSYPRPGNNYDGYGSSGGYKPSSGHEYGGSSGSYPAVSGGGDYGVRRPDDPRRDEQGDKSPLDRYPGHTGVGATFEFDSDRKQDCQVSSHKMTLENLDEIAPPLSVCKAMEDFECYDKFKDEEDDSYPDDPETVSKLMDSLLEQAIRCSNEEVIPAKSAEKKVAKT